MNATSRLRSILFVPGDRDDRFAKADSSGADAVVYDLEDAVSPDRKAVARGAVVRHLGASRRPGGPARLVRVNAASSGLLAEDLAALNYGSCDGLVLPRAMPDEVDALPDRTPPVLAIVETARGLRAAHALASSDRVVALLLGAVDLRAELGLTPRPDGLELLFARNQLVIDSAAAAKHPPIDSVFTAIADIDGFREDAHRGASLGMSGKLCIHPSQVPIANETYTPSEWSVAWARRIVDGFEEARRSGVGVVSIDGEMVDEPVVARARRILAAAESSS